jgi:hypothetical protein
MSELLWLGRRRFFRWSLLPTLRLRLPLSLPLSGSGRRPTTLLLLLLLLLLSVLALHSFSLALAARFVRRSCTIWRPAGLSIGTVSSLWPAGTTGT